MRAKYASIYYSRASALAVSRPMPEVAPVTSAILPSSEGGMFVKLGSLTQLYGMYKAKRKLRKSILLRFERGAGLRGRLLLGDVWCAILTGVLDDRLLHVGFTGRCNVATGACKCQCIFPARREARACYESCKFWRNAYVAKVARISLCAGQ